jgi:hypothetical protein
MEVEKDQEARWANPWTFDRTAFGHEFEFAAISAFERRSWLTKVALGQ